MPEGVRRLTLRARDLREGDVIATGRVTHVAPAGERVSVTRQSTRQREPYTSTFRRDTTVTVMRVVDVPLDPEADAEIARERDGEARAAEGLPACYYGRPR